MVSFVAAFLPSLYSSPLAAARARYMELLLQLSPADPPADVLSKKDQLLRRLICTPLYGFELHTQGEASTDPVDRTTAAYIDLFLWSLLTSRFLLADLFWEKSGKLVQNALLAALVLRRLASEAIFLRGDLQDEASAILLAADKYEQRAIAILGRCWNDDTTWTSSLVQAPVTQIPTLRGEGLCVTSLSLAGAAEAKMFLASPACTTVVREQWYGAFKPRNDAWWGMAAFVMTLSLYNQVCRDSVIVVFYCTSRVVIVESSTVKPVRGRLPHSHPFNIRRAAPQMRVKVKS